MKKMHLLPQYKVFNKLIILPFIVFFTVNEEVFSQVTITEVEKTQEVFILPQKYDSTTPILNQDHIPNYKQYIGLEIYLPPDERIPVRLCRITPKLIDINSAKPIIYRETKEVREGLHLINKEINSINYKYISTYLYNGVHDDTQYDNYTNHLNGILLSNGENTYNKNYTIIDVIYGQRYRDTLQKIQNRQDELKLKSSELNEIYVYDDCSLCSSSEILFLLQDDYGELLYCTKITEYFISVPYFNNQVALFKGKELICTSQWGVKAPTGSFEIKKDTYGNDKEVQKQITINKNEIWFCENVTLIKHPSYNSYKLTYILKKDGQQVLLLDLEYFKLLSKFNEEVENSKLTAEINKKRQIEEAERKAVSKKLEEEKLLSSAISKYGYEMGNLIGKNKVKVGMNKEMCSDSWGTPFYINKTISVEGTFEVWHYKYGNELYFKNGLLFKINTLE